MGIWDDIANGSNDIPANMQSALSYLPSGATIKSGVQNIGNILGGLGAGIQGNGTQYLQGLQERNANTALMGVGQDLANGNIDQAQYLKSVAQYDPITYQRMMLSRLNNQPSAVIQINDAIKAALNNGDLKEANRLMSLVRSGAYGVDTYTQNDLPPQYRTQQPTSNVTTAELPPLQDGNVPNATNVGSVAEQQAQNAARKKQLESDAVNQSDLKYKPDIAYNTEAEKQKAEREGIAPKELETKRSQAYVAALEAAPLLKTLKDLNEGTIDAPYAAAFQPILKMTDSQKAVNLDLMKQARLELAAPLAKQLGVNPTDKDFQASLDRIFDISSTKESRAAQIKALTNRVMSKPDLYNTDKATGAEKVVQKMEQSAMPMPTDKTGLKANRLYQTPRGVALWDGEKFIQE